MNVRRSLENVWPEKSRIDDDARILRHSLGSGATPLSTTNLPEVARRQETVQSKLRSRITRKLRDRSPLIRDFAEQNFLGRFARRMDRNRASYDTRLVAEIPDGIRDAHDRVLVGDGSVKDALEVMTALQMRSIELARLTHPNSDMHTNPQLQDMRYDTYDAVIDLGGEVYDGAEPSYELSNLDTIVPSGELDEEGRPIENAAVREGVMATAKRRIATLPDGTSVIERTSYIVDLNELPPELSNAIRSVNTLNVGDPLKALAEAVNFEELLPYLIENNYSKSVIPMSTTIYAHNSAIAKIIKDRSNPEKSEEPSDSMRRVHDAFAQDIEVLAGMWGMTSDEARHDLARRGIGAHAVKRDMLDDDDE